MLDDGWRRAIHHAAPIIWHPAERSARQGNCGRRAGEALMVPWPIALLTLFYGAVTAASGAAIWNIALRRSDQLLVWPVGWLVLSAAIMCGLPLFRPWARVLAITGSILLMAVTLAIAGLFVASGRPLIGLLATIGAGMHVVVIRYLRRPEIKKLFRIEECGLRIEKH